MFLATILAYPLKECRRNSRHRDKCNSHHESGNDREKSNTQSIEQTRQPIPDEIKLKTLEAKVRPLES
ncbi:MAG: hypothetical protein ACTSXP_19595 [Promethearchaeota archaeon]